MVLTLKPTVDDSDLVHRDGTQLDERLTLYACVEAVQNGADPADVADILTAALSDADKDSMATMCRNTWARDLGPDAPECIVLWEMQKRDTEFHRAWVPDFDPADVMALVDQRNAARAALRDLCETMPARARAAWLAAMRPGRSTPQGG